MRPHTWRADKPAHTSSQIRPLRVSDPRLRKVGKRSAAVRRGADNNGHIPHKVGIRDWDCRHVATDDCAQETCDEHCRTRRCFLVVFLGTCAGEATRLDIQASAGMNLAMVPEIQAV